ncbi:hypothetical protein TNCV_4641291 [Trichonephila clavipes]|nr:hypothetical protein TNCV_4641291 [Trichonephila clavipes]
MVGPRAPTPQRCSTGCSGYRQSMLKGAAVKSNTTPNQIKGAEPVWRYVMQQFSSLSTRFLQTRIRYLRCCRQKRNSSVNTMPFHSVARVRRSSHHWRRKPLWYPVKDKRSNGCLAHIPLCYKRRRMVRVDTE